MPKPSQQLLPTPALPRRLRAGIAKFQHEYRTLLGATSKPIVTYHGTKGWSSARPILAPSVQYLLGRGRSMSEALDHALGLLVHVSDFSNGAVLDRGLFNAQAIGPLSPFVSTTRNRAVARSFALDNDTPGYIVTLEGPEDVFFDFNRVREACRLPAVPQFHWLQELGLPLQVTDSVQVIRAERITGVEEACECLFSRDG